MGERVERDFPRFSLLFFSSSAALISSYAAR